MRRYLINLYRNHEGFQNIKVFSVSDDFNRPKDLLVENSICYCYIYSDKSKEEIEASYLGLEIVQETQTLFRISFQNVAVHSDGFLYLLGDLVIINGVRYCSADGFYLTPLDSIKGFSKIVIIPMP